MHDHLFLAGITRLGAFSRRAQRDLDIFVFDPHRLALPAWACALADKPPALLLTLDRHFDLVAPANPPPNRSAGLPALDHHTRYELDVRNVDHVLAAADAGLLTDIIAVARKSPRGATEEPTYNGHTIVRAKSLEALLALPEAELLYKASSIILDLDLDCFTTPSDVDADVLLSWPADVIEAFLMPQEPFWDALIPKLAAITLAREPYHVGGLIQGGRLFETFAQVFFGNVLGADLP